MRQTLVIRHARSNVSPRHRPPPRRVYTPTPDGYERFLQECLVLARGEGHAAAGAWAVDPARGDTAPAAEMTLDLSY
jgi:hypothetical protein